MRSDKSNVNLLVVVVVAVVEVLKQKYLYQNFFLFSYILEDFLEDISF